METKKRWRISLILLPLVFGIAPCFGDTLTDVTSQTSVSLANGSELIVNFGTWTYSSNNRGYSPYPTSLEFEAYGPALTAALAAVPNSSAQYYAGYELSAYLESSDGTAIAPLVDGNASHAGFADGTLLVTPGTYTGSGGTQQIAMIEGSIALTPVIAQSLFGPDAAQSWVSDARVVLVNNGQQLTFGLAGANSLKPAFLEPGLAGAGPVTTSGVTTSIQLDIPSNGANGFVAGPLAAEVPEPSTVGLFAGAMVLMFGIGVFRLRRGRV